MFDFGHCRALAFTVSERGSHRRCFGQESDVGQSRITQAAISRRD